MIQNRREKHFCTLLLVPGVFYFFECTGVSGAFLGGAVLGGENGFGYLVCESGGGLSLTADLGGVE